MKVIGYTRVSTDKQVQFGLSLEAQKQKIRQYCALYELDLIEVIVDGGESAETLNRQGIKKAIHLLEAGKASGLIVTKLDRLTRSIKDLNYLLENLFKKVSLFSVSELIDTRSPSGRLVLNILTSVSQWERETIAERTRSGLLAKKMKKKQVINGGAPYGWDWINGVLVENSKEQEALTKIKTWRSRGMTFRAIANQLSEMKIKTKKGLNNWSATTVRRTLLKDTYDNYTGGQTPLGWKLDLQGNEVPHEEEQELIRIVRDYRAIGLSYQAIGQKLTESTFTSRTGNPKFSKSAAKRLNDAETIAERTKRCYCV